ncbi:MAG: hypothetical protein R3B68_03540 [Phycisphaerales bacterium]
MVTRNRSVNARARASRGVVMAVAPLVLALAAGSAHAQTSATWQAAANNNWFTPAAWDIVQVPNNAGPMTFNAFIGPGLVGGPFIATLDAPATIESLTLTQLITTLDLSTNTLTLNQNLTVNQATVQATPPLGGGTLDVTGNLFLTESRFIGVSLVSSPTSQIFLNTTGGLEDFICDTDVNHRGRLRYQGAGAFTLDGNTTITLDSTATFEIETASAMITGMGAPAINNAGSILQAQPGAMTLATGVAITNTGTIDISAGSFSTDGVTIPGGVLADGTWRVSNGASLDLQGAALTTNAATIEIDGPGSLFSALAGIQTNDAAGTLRLTGGNLFTTAGAFTNDGLLNVGDASEFTVVSGSALTNFAGGALSGGEFDIGGTLRFDGADVTDLDSTITLSGPASQILDENGLDGIRNLDTIAGAGDLTLAAGRTFTAGNDLTVATTGRLGVDVGSTFTVPAPFNITNFASGTFTGGVFDIAGTLVIEADVETLAGDFTLDGPVSNIIRPGGGDVFENLNLIDTDGALTLRNGRTLSVLGSLTVNGSLTIENGPPDNPTIISVPSDLFHNAGVADLRNGGTIEVGTTAGQYRLAGGTLRGSGTVVANLVQTGGVVEPGQGAGTLFIEGNWALDPTVTGLPGVSIELGGTGPGMADFIDASGNVVIGGGTLGGHLSLSLIDGYVPSLAGDTFEIIRGTQRQGQFRTATGPMVGTTAAFEVFYTGTSVWVTVYAVPAPGSAGLLGMIGCVASRRRRR